MNKLTLILVVFLVACASRHPLPETKLTLLEDSITTRTSINSYMLGRFIRGDTQMSNFGPNSQIKNVPIYRYAPVFVAGVPGAMLLTYRDDDTNRLATGIWTTYDSILQVYAKDYVQEGSTPFIMPPNKDSLKTYFKTLFLSEYTENDWLQLGFLSRNDKIRLVWFIFTDQDRIQHRGSKRS